MAITFVFFDELQKRAREATVVRHNSERFADLLLASGELVKGYFGGPRTCRPELSQGDVVRCIGPHDRFGCQCILSHPRIGQVDLPRIEIDGGIISDFTKLVTSFRDAIWPVSRPRNRLISLDDILVGGHSFELLYAESFEIVWRCSDESRTILNHDAYAEVLNAELELTDESEDVTEIQREFARAKAGEGPSLFDRIHELLDVNVHVSLRLI